MKNYYIDKKILSILFKISDDDLLEETNLLFSDILLRFTEGLAREFLTEKNISEVEINEYLDNLESENPSIKELLASQEFITKLVRSRNEFLKKIYDTYLPEVSEEGKRELESYIELLELDNKGQIDNMRMVLDLNQRKDKFIQEGTLTKESFDQIIDEEINKLDNTDETQTPEATDANQPVQSAPSDSQNVPTQVSQ
ncbi:MAG TPA: hypothetical protein PK863_06465 [Candidatus Dojkabacteria bacterium]|nr:hypothetical protein [Candidatus Dojkabacteria bacterium]HRP51524.1 hypothetical protein [Candidatus Dojkabacteria bacterium]